MRQDLRRRTRRKPEPTVALINIVFLMLIFFLVASTLAPPRDGDLTLVQTVDLPPQGPPDALVVHADGRLSWRGDDVASVSTYLASLPSEAQKQPRIVPDATLSATELIRIGQAFRAAGAQSVIIVTERALQ